MFALLSNNQLDLLDPCECHTVVLWLYLPYKHNWSHSMLLIYSTYSKPFRMVQKNHWFLIDGSFFPHQSEQSEKNMYWQQSKHGGWKASQKTLILTCFWRKQQKQNRNGNDHGNDSLTYFILQFAHENSHSNTGDDARPHNCVTLARSEWTLWRDVLNRPRLLG